MASGRFSPDAHADYPDRLCHLSSVITVTLLFAAAFEK
jgi:hypothetical protein